MTVSYAVPQLRSATNSRNGLLIFRDIGYEGRREAASGRPLCVARPSFKSSRFSAKNRRRKLLDFCAARNADFSRCPPIRGAYPQGQLRVDFVEKLGFSGLVPRRYQSGEVDYTGGISKCGDRRVRTLLYEAANVMLTRYKGQLKLKDWAFAIAQRSTMRKARVALARRLAIIMHAILRDGTEFASA